MNKKDKQHIIIFYEIVKRELEACKRLKKELEEVYGYDVWLLSLTWDYIKANDIANKYKIDAIIMPWMYTEENYKLIIPFLLKNKNLKVFNLYNEQIASDETLPITLCRGDLVKQNVFHLCWGEYFKDLLEKNGVPRTNAIVAGNSRLDSSFFSRYSREDLSRMFKLDPKKKWILFAESRDWVLYEDNLRYRISLGLPEVLEIKSYESHKKALFRTYEELNSLENDFFDEYELIYRPHPASPTPNNINNKVKINSKFTIYDWLDNVDCYLTATSTSIFEADAKGVPSIVVEGEDWPQEFKTYGLDEYHKIHSLRELNKECIENAEKKARGKNIFEKYIGKCDGENYKRISKIIHGINTDKSIEPMQLIEVNLPKSMLRSRIKLFLAKVLVKTNMAKLLPKNSTYFVLRNEAPFIKKNKKLLND